MRKPRPPVSADRRALLAKVHIAKKDLELEDADYRAILTRTTGQSSSARCTDRQLIALLDAFRALGWSDGRKLSENPQVRLIYALWGEIKPHLDQPTTAALRGFCKRMTGVEDPDWLNPQQANIVIEGLKGWREHAQQGGTGDPGGGDAHA